MFSRAQGDARELRSVKQSGLARRRLRPAKIAASRRLLLEWLEPRMVLSANPAAPQLTLDAQDYDSTSILVRFQPGAAAVNPADVLIGSSNGREFSLVPGLRSVKLSPGRNVEAALQVFRSNPNVIYAEPNGRVQAALVPNDDLYSSLYGMEKIDAPEAWDIATGSTNVLVAVIDTGIDYTHPDLAANIWTNPGEIPGNGSDDDGNGYVDDVHGYDFVGWEFGGGDSDPYDDHYHGTHVAGTIGAVGNNADGVAGVNWNAKIAAVKFLDSGGSGSWEGAIAAIEYSVAIGANLSNNSWGGSSFSAALYDAIAAAGDAGHLFVAAAGNEYSNGDVSPSYPAGYSIDRGVGYPGLDNIIAVAATDSADNKADFSNWGLTSVHLGAPGYSILSTLPGNDYGYLSGTSMASPHVAGVAALAWGLAGSSSYSEIKDAILSSVDPVTSLSTTGSTPVATGGRLNAFKTLQAVGMSVAGSAPAAGSIIATTPTDFVVHFSHPYDPDSLNDLEDELTVNGIAASSWSPIDDDDDSVTFHFGASPITAQGLQSMQIAEGSVAADPSTGLPDLMIHAWNATFRYDTLPMQVVSTSPLAGSAVELPLAWIDVNLNEPVDPDSVDASDLYVSQGVVTGASLLDADTIRFSLDGVTSEGTLDFSIAAGALADTHHYPTPTTPGNPNLAFAGSYTLDIGTVPISTPLSPVAPLGSLIYNSTASGIIGTAGDPDSFTINVDANQTITVLVTPSGTLRPTVTIGGTSNTAASVGKKALLQTLTAGGVQTITVSGADGTTGSYSVQVFLNTALETESHDGDSNNSPGPGNAQDLDASFTDLLKGATRGAVMGRTDGNPTETLFNANFETTAGDNLWTKDSAANNLWHQSVGHRFESGHDSANSMYFGAGEKYVKRGQKPETFTPGTYEVVKKGKGGGGAQRASGTITSPDILLEAGGQITVDFDYLLVTESNAGRDVAALQIKPISSGTWTTLETYNDDFESSSWIAASTVDISDYAGQTVQLRFSFDTMDAVDNKYEGWYVDDVVVRQTMPRDNYSVSVGEGQYLTVALQSTGDVNVLLQNQAGTTTLATGVPGAINVSKMIYNYGPLTAGTYNLAVTGQTNTPYTMVVLRGAVFDREGNDTAATAQPFGETHVALGSLSNGETVTLDAYDSGWWNSYGDHDEFNDNYIAGACCEGSGDEYRDFFVFNLASVSQQIAAAELLIYNPFGGYYSPDATESYTLFDISTPLSELQASGSGQTAIFDDLGTGSTHGSRVVSYADDGQVVSVALNSAGVAALNSSLGSQTALGGAVTTLSGFDDQHIFGYSGYEIAQLALTMADPADWYSFTAAAGEEIYLNTATPGDGAGEPGNTLNPHLRLYDSSGVLVAEGELDPDNPDDTRNEEIFYTVPAGAGGTYRVEVTAEGGTKGEYVLDPVSICPAAPAAPALLETSAASLLASFEPQRVSESGSTAATARRESADSTARSAARLPALTPAGVDQSLAVSADGQAENWLHARRNADLDPSLLDLLSGAITLGAKADPQ